MTPEARAARERKQKIFVVVGGLFLVALLAIQLPRILGGSDAGTEATDTTTVETDVVQASPAVPSAGEPSAGEPSPVSFAPRATLTSFSEFTRRNPFVQQVDYDATADGSEGDGSEGDGSGASERSGGSGSESGEETVKDFTVGSKSGPAATVISVNGKRQAVRVGEAFPALDPVFLLLAERPERKTVVVGVAGGSYANGSRSTALEVGKPLVLVNTTTGARYRLVLVVVGSGGEPVAAEPGSP